MTVSRAWRVTALAALVGVMSAPAAFAQKKDDKKEQPKYSDAQRQELTPLVKTIDEVMKTSGASGTYTAAGKDDKVTVTAAGTENPFSWHNDFLRASNQLIYVPFIVTVEPGKVASSVAGYLRVVPKGATGAAPAAATDGKEKKDNKDKAAAPTYPFEDVYFTELRSGPAGPAPAAAAAGAAPAAAASPLLKLMRAFAVPAGSYDVYLALRDRAAQGAKDEAGVKVTVFKHELVVPDYWNGELTTSTIIVADKVESVTAPVPPEQQRERPYVLGSAEIVPALDNKFQKSEELGVIFQVYGAQVGSDKKPDVTIEYVFYQKEAAGEKLFNKTVPTTLNGQSLPPNFDPEQGHQLVGGQQIPLSSFPTGDFRMEIKITDNKSSKSITREVPFSVAP